MNKKRMVKAGGIAVAAFIVVNEIRGVAIGAVLLWPVLKAIWQPYL